MTDSEPPDHDLETRLISAGMRETPPPATLQRTLASLGLGASAIAAASSAGALGATKATTSIGVFGLVKWASVGAASGLMVTAATYGVQHAARPVARSTPSSVAASSASDLATSAMTRELLPVAPPSALVLPSAEPARPSRTAPATAEMDAPLATELAFVDRGREAFQRKEPLAALSLLEGYERSFPKLRLMPEVLYLRMVAHRQRGENERAMMFAERLVRDFPRSPHASSARSILRDTSAP